MVRLTAAGVNFKDIYERGGRAALRAPFVPGGEGADTVLAIGADVTGFHPGDRVAWCAAPGSLRRTRRAPRPCRGPRPRRHPGRRRRREHAPGPDRPLSDGVRLPGYPG
ncbi:alcohol dehydrogenase catalytic domain-containing protein [Streptomyces sp. SID685]|nr:alcohol dehydrogenase catalytic domain-containing protein [Streptomyces sp. SID685]